MIKVKIKDQTGAGDILNEIIISIENECIKLRDLIALRVETEVKAHNDRKKEVFNGLIKPNPVERILNNRKPQKHKPIDAEQQVYVALEAFTKNGFFVLIDDEQVVDLDTEVLVSNDTSVSFIKLTQLVGG